MPEERETVPLHASCLQHEGGILYVVREQKMIAMSTGPPSHPGLYNFSFVCRPRFRGTCTVGSLSSNSIRRLAMQFERPVRFEISSSAIFPLFIYNARPDPALPRSCSCLVNPLLASYDSLWRRPSLADHWLFRRHNVQAYGKAIGLVVAGVVEQSERLDPGHLRETGLPQKVIKDPDYPAGSAIEPPGIAH